MPRSLSLMSSRNVGAVALLLAAIGCGSLADPNDGTLAKVSGQLQGAAPTGARVALVWHGPAGFLVAGEAPLVNGTFTMELASPPPDSAFVTNRGPDGSDASTNGSVGSDTPSANAGTSSLPLKLRPMTEISGGTSKPLTAAVAGFIVYADSNGNGKLDVTTDNAVPSDAIIGAGNRILLAYLRDGSQLDLDNARDDTGVTPTRGYNLWSTSGDRWVSLSSVDLRLDVKTLPSAVCNAVDGGDAPSTSSGGVYDGGASTAYPSPDDPNLHCGADGMSYTYSTPCDPPPATQDDDPKGLCDGSSDDVPDAYACVPDTEVFYEYTGYSGSWPCSIDGGAYDGGSFDPDAGSPHVPDAGH